MPLLGQAMGQWMIYLRCGPLFRTAIPICQLSVPSRVCSHYNGLKKHPKKALLRSKAPLA